MTYPSKARLTDAMVRKFPLLPSGQKFVADEVQPGLYLRIGKGDKGWAVQKEFRRLGKRITKRKAIGSVADMNVDAARERAVEVIAELNRDAGKEKASKGLTLGEAWAKYRDGKLNLKGRSPKTIEGYEKHITSPALLGDWLDTPIAALAEDQEAVAQRHAEMTKLNGPYMANATMKTLRAIYNWNRKRSRSLPLDGPTTLVEWNPEKRADDGMSAEELPRWWAQYSAMRNRVRAEYHLFLLLTSSRTTAAAEARWEHLDVKRRVLRQPDPKGGEKKAFDLPLSRAALACLARARRAGRTLAPGTSDIWIFPGNPSKRRRGADEFVGHLTTYGEDDDTLLATGKALRQTWATHAQAAQVPLFFQKLIMNHSVGNDVTLGYATASALRPQLIEAQDAVSRVLMGHLRQQKQGSRRIAA